MISFTPKDIFPNIRPRAKHEFSLIWQEHTNGKAIVYKNCDLSQYNPNHEYITLALFKRNTVKRIQSNVLYRIGYTIEHDCISKELQEKIFLDTLGNCAWQVDSANKSYHFHVVLSEGVKPGSDDDIELQRLFRTVFPFLDTKCITDCARLARNPNGIRKPKPEKGILEPRKQHLVNAGRRQNVKQLIKKLRGIAGDRKQPSIREPKFEGDTAKDTERIIYSVAQLIKCGYDLQEAHTRACIEEMCHRIGLCPQKCLVDAQTLNDEEIAKAQQSKKRLEQQKTSPVTGGDVTAFSAWLDRKLRGLDMFNYIGFREGNTPIDKGNGVYKHIRCVIPGHEDKTPSAHTVITDSGIQLYLCNCQDQPLDLIGLLTKVYGLSLPSACLKLFGFSFRESCDYCGNSVLFDSMNKCYELDEVTPHRCKSKVQMTQQPHTEYSSDHVASEIPEQTPEPIIFVEPDTTGYKDIEHIADDIRELDDNSILLFSAPTGTGKTYLYANEIVRMSLRTVTPITVLTNSTKSVQSMVREIKEAAERFGIHNIDVTNNVIGKLADDTYKSNEIGQIAVTTYYRLGRKGHTNAPKVAASDIGDLRKQLIKDRILFCDEIQSLVDFCKVNEPLSARYYRTKDTYNIIRNCQVSNKNKDACAKCIMAYKRKSPDSKYHKSSFPTSFFETDRENHQQCERITEMFPNLWDIGTYENCEGLYNKFLEESIIYELDEPREVDETKDDETVFAEYLEDLLGKLKYPQLSMVSPEHRATSQPVSPAQALEVAKDERRQVIKFPVQACQIPHLKGYDIMPILQMLQATKIVMCSATVPKEAIKLLGDVIPHKGWSMVTRSVDKVKVKYNATFLTTHEQLTQNTVTHICNDLKEEQAIIAAKTQAEARSIYWGASENATLYTSGEYKDTVSNDEYMRPNDNGEKPAPYKPLLITYLRAAILTGLNFPDKNVMLIDCNSFYPQIICTERTREARMSEMLEKLETLIIQAMGRILRTNGKELERGQDYDIDKRRLVFVLHGLPKDMRLKLDDRLFYEQRVVPERFMTVDKPYKSVIDAIKEARNGENVTDYKSQEIARKKAELEEKKAEANEQWLLTGSKGMSSKQRRLVTMTAAQKRAHQKNKRAQKEAQQRKKCMSELTAKANDYKGKPWREFSRDTNLSRLRTQGKITKSDYEILMQIFDSGWVK